MSCSIFNEFNLSFLSIASFLAGVNDGVGAGIVIGVGIGVCGGADVNVGSDIDVSQIDGAGVSVGNGIYGADIGDGIKISSFVNDDDRFVWLFKFKIICLINLSLLLDTVSM